MGFSKHLPIIYHIVHYFYEYFMNNRAFSPIFYIFANLSVKKKILKFPLDKQRRMCYNVTRIDEMRFHAGMAELADALDSGSSRSNSVEVQVLLPAPTRVVLITARQNR